MRAALALLVAAGTAAAQPVPLPENATLVVEEVADPGSVEVATGPWSDDGLPVRRLTGRVERGVWRIDAEGLTSAGILEPIAMGLERAGYETLFSCETEGCGGFDFRFAIDVVDPPSMHVDLADFRYLSAVTPEAGLVAVLVSRSTRAGFVQVLLADTGRSAEVPRTPRLTAEPSGDSLAAALDAAGHAILSGVTFDVGSARLAPGGAAALEALAAWLADHPDLRVVLVGHTDAVGGLDGNIALSRQRAASVVERLVGEYGVPRRQVEAEGMGYLAPVGSNLTAEGREQNRRVEAVVIATQ